MAPSHSLSAQNQPSLQPRPYKGNPDTGASAGERDCETPVLSAAHPRTPQTLSGFYEAGGWVFNGEGW